MRLRGSTARTGDIASSPVGDTVQRDKRTRSSPWHQNLEAQSDLKVGTSVLVRRTIVPRQSIDRYIEPGINGLPDALCTVSGLICVVIHIRNLLRWFVG